MFGPFYLLLLVRGCPGRGSERGPRCVQHGGSSWPSELGRSEAEGRPLSTLVPAVWLTFRNPSQIPKQHIVTMLSMLASIPDTGQTRQYGTRPLTIDLTSQHRPRSLPKATPSAFCHGTDANAEMSGGLLISCCFSAVVGVTTWSL